MNRISPPARWLVVLVGSFAVLVVLFVPGLEDDLTAQLASQALIFAYALAGAYLLYDILGRGKPMPPAATSAGRAGDTRL